MKRTILILSLFLFSFIGVLNAQWHFSGANIFWSKGDVEVRGGNNFEVTDGTSSADGYMSNAQSITPTDAEVTDTNVISAGINSVDVGAETYDADDFIVLPLLASVPDGHQIIILCNSGDDFELRTPATTDEEINSVDSDGTQEYVCTDTEVVFVIKVNDEIGWVAFAYSQIGAVVAAVVPD